MKNEITKIISNCPLCEEKSLHIVGDDELQVQQCINCGYVTSGRYKLNGKTKQEHSEWDKLGDEMKDWSTVKNDRIWLPTIMTLPLGMLYPINNDDGDMIWAFAKMIDIPKEEQKKYPREDGKGFHTKRMDTDDPKIYDIFLTALAELNQEMKNAQTEKPKPTEIKLPKLKKIK